MMERATCSAPGHDRETVPEAIPSDAPKPSSESKGEIRLPRDLHGQINGRLARISWRARMRWLDDGGR